MDAKLFVLRLPSALSTAQAQTLCLAADEAKAARYRMHPDSVPAQHALAAQVLLRVAAAKTLGVSARDVRIVYTENGRPTLPGTGLHCSVSHTDGLCVCALSSAPLGVDAERIRPASLRVAQRVFSPDEQAALRQSADRDRCFFTLWTRHESYVKLLGTGLRDIALPVPPHVRMQTLELEEKFVITVCMFTESS